MKVTLDHFANGFRMMRHRVVEIVDPSVHRRSMTDIMSAVSDGFPRCPSLTLADNWALEDGYDCSLLAMPTKEVAGDRAAAFDHARASMASSSPAHKASGKVRCMALPGCT
jgi:hypothetical protein